MIQQGARIVTRVTPWLQLLALSLIIVVALRAPGSAVSVTEDPVPYGRAPDYSWVAGPVERVNLEGGFWRVRYQRPGAPVDEYGGTFVLLLDKSVARTLEAGKMYRFHGMVRKELVGIHMGGTYYMVTSVRSAR